MKIVENKQNLLLSSDARQDMKMVGILGENFPQPMQEASSNLEKKARAEMLIKLEKAEAEIETDDVAEFTSTVKDGQAEAPTKENKRKNVEEDDFLLSHITEPNETYWIGFFQNLDSFCSCFL